MASIYLKERHDIGILRSDATTKVGLMLVQQNGKPLYRTSTERYLKNQYFSGAPDYGAIDPQSELPIIQDDWRSGFGLEIADSSDKKRYYSSIGMDLRHRGMALAGPTPTTVTKPTTAVTTVAFGNADMEADTNWTGGARDNAKAHGGTYSWKVNNAGAYQYSVSTYPPWTNDYRSREFVFKAWVYATAGSTGRISIYGVVEAAYTYSSYHTGTPGWEQLTATVTLNAAETNYYPLLHSDTASDVWFDDCTLTESACTIGKVACRAEFNDALYASFGSLLCKLNAAGTEFEIVADMGATITDLEPFTDSKLYIGLGTSDNYFYMTTAEVFIHSTKAVKAKFLVTVHSSSPTLYATINDYQYRTSTDPSEAGSWVAAASVGSSYYAFTDLITKAGAAYFPKEDMPYYLGSTGNVLNDLAPKLQALTRSTSGKNAITDGEKIMYPCGDQGLLEIDGTTLTWRSPSEYCTNLSDFVGRVQAMAYDDQYWYAIVDNGTKVEVLAGGAEIIDGTSRFVWHPLAEIPATFTNCETAWVSNVLISGSYYKRLFVTSTVSTESLYYVPLTGYGNVLSDANRKFSTSSPYFITPYYHGNFKGEDKAWIKATLTMGHDYNAGRYFTAHYQTLEGTMTSVGNFTGSTSSMIQSRYIDVTNKPVSSMMRFKFTAATNDPDYTPVLISFDIRSILRPIHRKVIECAVRCEDGIRDKKGQPLEGTNADYIRTVLDEARDATWPFTFYDIHGATKYGVILPSEPESKITASLKNENPESYFYIRIQEVSLA